VSAREQVWIMVDVETRGPVYGVHSLTELGAAVGSAAAGVVDRLEAVIRPLGDAVVTSRDSFDRARAEGLDPRDAMQRFAGWTAPHREQRARSPRSRRQTAPSRIPILGGEAGPEAFAEWRRPRLCRGGRWPPGGVARIERRARTAPGG
jgi:hypothetical protein